MKERQKKMLAVIAGLGVVALAWKRKADGRVLMGPVTVTEEKAEYDSAETAARVQQLALAVKLARQFMGADPNTLASRRPSASEQSYIEGMLALGRELALVSQGVVPYPTAEEQRFALAQKLPGDELQKANAQLYDLLGVDPTDTNEASRPLTAQNEALARQLIAKWRPYSKDAVDTLFVLLDEARELGEAA